MSGNIFRKDSGMDHRGHQVTFCQGQTISLKNRNIRHIKSGPRFILNLWCLRNIVRYEMYPFTEAENRQRDQSGAESFRSRIMI